MSGIYSVTGLEMQKERDADSKRNEKMIRFGRQLHDANSMLME
jgi:hypothetical protein